MAAIKLAGTTTPIQRMMNAFTSLGSLSHSLGVSCCDSDITPTFFDFVTKIRNQDQSNSLHNYITTNTRKNQTPRHSRGNNEVFDFTGRRG